MELSMIRPAERITNDGLRFHADAEVVVSLLDANLWIVEEELRMCIGLPPWSDAALCFTLAEIVRDFGKYRDQNHHVAEWIRRKARQTGQRLERTLARRHARHGFVHFTENDTLQALVGSLVDRHRSSHWAPAMARNTALVRKGSGGPNGCG
jgi:hypothetical protein